MQDVNENKKKKNPLVLIGIAVLILLLLLLGVTFGRKGQEETGKNPEVTDTVQETPAPTEAANNGGGTVFIIDDRSQSKADAVEAQKNPLSGRNVFFAGYADATINKNTTVALENLPDNEDFLIKYTIINKEDNSTVFETNLIQAGQCVVWVPGETLEPGTYNLQILQSPYWHDGAGNFTPLTAGSTDVCYELVK